MKTLICPNTECGVPHYMPQNYFVCESCGWILVKDKKQLRQMSRRDRKSLSTAQIVNLKNKQFLIQNAHD